MSDEAKRPDRNREKCVACGLPRADDADEAREPSPEDDGLCWADDWRQCVAEWLAEEFAIDAGEG